MFKKLKQKVTEEQQQQQQQLQPALASTQVLWLPLSWFPTPLDTGSRAKRRGGSPVTLDL